MIQFKDRNILFYAFRYALGRSTYAVADVVESIINIWESIHPAEQLMYKKEIKEAIESKRAGMDMDVIQWEKILELKVSSV